nr:PREDICTED: uncharacterized protein LOC109037125 [Bemisia tabaci]
MILFTVIALYLVHVTGADPAEPDARSMDISAINSLVRRPQIHLDPNLRKALLRVLTRLDQEDRIENSSDNYQVVTQEDFMSFFNKERQGSQEQPQEQGLAMKEVLPTPQNQENKSGKSLVDEKIFSTDNSLKNIHTFGLKTHHSSINEIPSSDIKTGFFFRVPFPGNDTTVQSNASAETFAPEESQNIHEANFKNSLSHALSSHEAAFKASHEAFKKTYSPTNHETPFRSTLKNAVKSPETFMSMLMHAQNNQDSNFKNSLTNFQNSHEANPKPTFLNPENVNNLRTSQESQDASKSSNENSQGSQETNFKSNFDSVQSLENFKNSFEANQRNQEALKNSFDAVQSNQDPFKNSFEYTQNSQQTAKNSLEALHNNQDVNVKTNINVADAQRQEPSEINETSLLGAEQNLSRNNQEERVASQESLRPITTQETKNSREVETTIQVSKEEASNVGQEVSSEEDDKQAKESSIEENSSKSNGTDNPELKLEGKVEFSEAPLVVAFTVQQDSRGHPHKVIPLSYRGGVAPVPQAEEPKATPVTKISDPTEITFYKSLAQTSSLFKQNPSLASTQPFASIDRPFSPSNDLSRANAQFLKSQSEIIPSQNFIATQQALQPIGNQPQFTPVINQPQVNFAPSQPQQVTSFDFVPSVAKQEGFVPFQPQRQNFFEPKFQQQQNFDLNRNNQNFIGNNDLVRNNQNFIGNNDLVPPARHAAQNYIATNDLVPPRNFDDRRRFPTRQNFEFQRSVDVPQSNFFQRRPPVHQNFFPQQVQQQPLVELNRVNRKEPNQFVGNFGFNSQQRNNYNSHYQFQPAAPVPLDNHLRHLFYQSGIDHSQRFAGGAEDLNIVTKVLALNHVGRNDISEQSFSETSRNQVKVRPPSRVIEPPFE